MSPQTENFQDVMLVCRNGHVVTDRLRTSPDRGLSHCERCGADTLSSCPTCGHELPGATIIPGMTLVGRRSPPEHCPACGVAFPWAGGSTEPQAEARPALDTLLRRLPRVIRQLRDRHGDRPSFRVQDEHDLADLLRALLPLAFDDIRPESRTPSYAPDTRTDLILNDDAAAAAQTAIVVKMVGPATDPNAPAQQLGEDAEYYVRQPRVHQVVVLVYDPEGRIFDAATTETAWSKPEAAPPVRCVIATW